MADTNHRAATLASLIVGLAFLSLWFWLLPPWLGFRAQFTGWGWLRLVAVIPAALGFAVALRCMWDFGRTGRGTPAPFAPPQRLVVAGFYRYVRNPMYLGFFVGWAGLWIMFGRANPTALATAGVVVLGVHIFVMAYEEPTLSRTFGEQYEEYCRNVPRWIPRLTPWYQDGDRSKRAVA